MKLVLKRSRCERGVALVIVLTLVVLVTVAVVAFFAMATSNRVTETSRANRTKADVLARTAGEYAIGEFVAEIRDPAHSDVPWTGVYLPRTPEDSIPRRRIATALNSGAPDFFNLVRQSVPGADSNASDHSSGDPARGGRIIPPARWNLPRLLSGSGFDAVSQLPSWIYVSADGGLTDTPTDRVIGRFSYNVYDVGGLLHTNVAGFPAGVSPIDLDALKGLGSGADLSVVPVAQPAIDGLLQFRNAQTYQAPSNYVLNADAAFRDGFLSLTNSNGAVTFTNNYFTSRQDLLRYALTENTGLENALPYLTHFSHNLSAPSWVPPTTTSANPAFPGIRWSSDTTITRFLDDGTPESVVRFAGDSLLQQRFSLAKLAWLTPTGPAPGISDQAIRICFGLEWNSGLERWDYVGSDGGSAPLSAILTLSEVATRNREPNFFEILKAGIAEGSLGQVAENKTLAGTTAQLLESNKDYQILRIGAAIIDQADEDNFPTILSFADDLEAAGIEDLPYFHQINMIVLRQTDTSQTPNKLTHADVIWAPVFFNPHRPSTPNDGPSEIVMDVANGTLLRVLASSGSELVQELSPPKDLASLPSISIANGDFERFRAAPLPAASASAPNRLENLVSYASGDQSVQALRLFSYQTEYMGEWPANRPVSDNAIFRINVDDVVIRLSYRTPEGNLRTYATMGGHEAVIGSGINGSPHSSQGSVIGFGPSFLTPARLQQANLSLSYYATLWDPRTSRLGPSFGQTRRISDPPPVSGISDRIRSAAPFLFSDSDAQPILPALWPEGQRDAPGPGSYSNFADPDGRIRPGDAWLGQAANPFRNLTDNSRRPVVLQRPFRTVGELGYAFRDSPWKSLSFFDESSGDAALLDLFSVADEPAVTSGRVHLATRQAPVLNALVEKSAESPDGSQRLSGATALAVAEAFRNRSFDASGAPTSQLVANTGGIPAFLSSAGLPANLPIIKYEREAIARALASGTQSRTWNLLIDLVAQSGQFAGGITASDFVVEGEKRFWLSVSIDRFTGRVVAEQWEAVHE